MVFYILDIVFKEFQPLPYVDSNLRRRWAYFPDNEIIRNSFNWCQDEKIKETREYMMLRGLKKIPMSEYMKPDVVYLAEDLEFFKTIYAVKIIM